MGSFETNLIDFHNSERSRSENRCMLETAHHFLDGSWAIQFSMAWNVFSPLGRAWFFLMSNSLCKNFLTSKIGAGYWEITCSVFCFPWQIRLSYYLKKVHRHWFIHPSIHSFIHSFIDILLFVFFYLRHWRIWQLSWSKWRTTFPMSSPWQVTKW